MKRSSLDLTVASMRAVVAIVDHGSMGKAARALQLCNASIQSSVRQAERCTGVRLFVRSRGKRGDARPTPAGEFVVGHCREALRHVDEVRALSKPIRKGLVA